VSLGLQPRRVLVHRAADLVQDVLQLGRLREGPLPVMAAGLHGQLVSSHVTSSLVVRAEKYALNWPNRSAYISVNHPVCGRIVGRVWARCGQIVARGAFSALSNNAHTG
jgi:hypothetical protein